MSARLVVAAVVVSVASAAGIDSVRASQQAVFRSGVDGVRLQVRVTDGGRPVSGLTRDRFVVRDNGVTQNVELVTAFDRLNAVVVLDLSDSVKGDPRRSRSLTTPLALMADAALAVVDSLLPPERVALLTFTDRPRLVVAPTPDKGRVRHALRGVQAEPLARTALWDALLAGASLVAGSEEAPVVFLVTDGCDNASWVSATAVARWLGRADVTVDVLGFEATRDVALSFEHDAFDGPLEWRRPTDATGGRLFAVGRQQDLARALVQRVSDLRHGYLLTYSPTGVGANDGWHKITVELRGARGRVQTRAGYSAGVK